MTHPDFRRAFPPPSPPRPAKEPRARMSVRKRIALSLVAIGCMCFFTSTLVGVVSYAWFVMTGHGPFGGITSDPMLVTFRVGFGGFGLLTFAVGTVLARRG